MERILLSSSTGLYGLAFLLAWPRSARVPSAILGLLGTAAALAYVSLRYYKAWPMTPMFMGSVAVPPFLALFGLHSARKAPEPERRACLAGTFGLAFAVGALSVICPKDFYLPFLKTASLFSQAHLVFNFLGKAAFFLAAAWALQAILAKAPKDGRIRGWLAIGFVFWTLSMLTGEIWSYVGWGLPVVWDDAVIVCFMATWFFYSALLHLFLGGRRQGARRALAAAGALWVVLVNVVPDLGPARWPPQLW